VRATEFVTEIGDSNYAVQQDFDRRKTLAQKNSQAKMGVSSAIKRNAQFSFQTPDGVDYGVGIHTYKSAKGRGLGIMVDFFDKGDFNSSYDISGTGNEFKVFSTVRQIVLNYLNEHPEINFLTFSAKNAEPSRVKLYSAAAKNPNKWFPGFTEVQSKTDDDITQYMFAKPKQVEEDLSRRGFLGGLGAAAMGAMGVDASAKQMAPAREEPPKLLSNNPSNETTILKTAKKAGMKGPELAQFMAQTKHESWDFDRLKEKPQPGVKDYYNKKYDVKYAPKTARILGNKHAGDGAKYHGRGFVQLTGRDNYRMAGKALGIDLLNHPELAEKPDVAAQIAVWYWNTRVKPNVQNFADTARVTKYINPAARGLENRHENFKDYMRII